MVDSCQSAVDFWKDIRKTARSVRIGNQLIILTLLLLEKMFTTRSLCLHIFQFIIVSSVPLVIQTGKQYKNTLGTKQSEIQEFPEIHKILFCWMQWWSRCLLYYLLSSPHTHPPHFIFTILVKVLVTSGNWIFIKLCQTGVAGRMWLKREADKKVRNMLLGGQRTPLYKCIANSIKLLGIHSQD